jgi:hypothetical protein
MKAKVRTIDIQAKEWFDKVNGNSYFSANIAVNFGLPTIKTYKMPFQYGYGDHYIDMATKELEKQKVITDLEHYNNGGSQALWAYCADHKIILRTHKQTNCLKRELNY